MKTKTLTINGVEYAYYQVGDETIYMKVIKSIGSLDTRESEEFFANMISVLESRRFTRLSYLNI